MRPSSDHSLERLNNAGNYEPGNVVWAASEAQQNNKRTSVYVEIDGQRMTVAQAVRARGLNEATVRTRLFRGWSVERAFQ